MRWDWGSAELDFAHPFFNAFSPGFEEDLLDPAIAIDDEIVRYRTDGKLDRLITMIDDVAAGALTDAQVVDELVYVIGSSGLPDGTGYRAWLLALQARLHEVRTAPDTLPREVGFSDFWEATHPRAAWFADDAVRDLVGDRVLDACDEQGRAWAAEPGGWRRQHFYADLGDLTGSMRTFGHTAPYVTRDGETVLDPDRTEPATGAVVVLERDSAGTVAALVAYPERHLDPALRAAYPDLCHWFGGYLFQTPRTPLLAMEAACRSTEDPARSRVRQQLTMLLLEEDDTIRAVLEACGSYLLPRNIRHWVDRTLWRLDAFDWLSADGGGVVE